MKKKINLSELTEVELRDIWENEARDFSQWLAGENNLALLGRTIDLNLLEPQTEQSAGDFSIDILCRDEHDHHIIIENQLERSDNTHLGQIIAYASVKKAKAVVWICKQARDEHIESISWLNEIAGEQCSFFLVEIKVFKIQDSPPAPKFEVIVQPNDWAKRVRPDTKRKFDRIDHDIMKFWQELIDYIDTQNCPPLQSIKPPKHHKDWSQTPIFSKGGGASIYLNINRKGNTGLILLTVRIYIPNDKPLFEKLKTNKEAIEKQINDQLSFGSRRDQNATWIKREIKYQLTDTQQRNKYIQKFYFASKQFVEILNQYS